MNQDLLNGLEQIRQILGLPIHVSSGLRCPIRNEEVRGVWDSLHLFGQAADVWTDGIDMDMIDRIAEIALSLGLGVIRYYGSRFIHIQIFPRDTIGD